MQTSRIKILEKKTYIAGFIALILIYIVGCISLGVRPDTRLRLCWLIKGTGGKVLASYPNPDGSLIIHVVKPDCGQTSYWGEIYDCSVRLDLEINHHQVVRGYDIDGECDVSVKWLRNAGEFEITYQSGKKSVTFIGNAFGVLP